MFAPIVEGPEATREMMSMFGGYNKNLRITEGEWQDENNLSTMFYPLLAPIRDSWTLLEHEPTGQGALPPIAPVGITAVNSMTYGYSVICVRTVGSKGVIYIGNTATTNPSTDPDGITVDPTTPKQYVLMGSYLVVFPDAVYFNINTPTDQGHLNENISSFSITGYPCDIDGNVLTGYTESPTAPASPSDGDVWLDTSGEKHEYKKWYASSSMWLTQDVYVKIVYNDTSVFTYLDNIFNEGDGVTLSIGAISETDPSLVQQVQDLNGSHVIQKIGHDYIVVIGIVDDEWNSTAKMTISRKAPAMDYVIECNNRLWGCKYGTVDGEHINEIYCSKLGDFRNWEVYEGLSTDSWRASIGLPGPWTGAVAYDGRPTFFKKDCIYKIYVSSSGAHQIATSEGPGVREGCWQSVAIVGSVLFYMSDSGVQAYTGTNPTRVSDNINTDKAYGAIATVWRKYYVVTFYPTIGTFETYTYDTELRVWHKISLQHPISYVKPSNDFITWQDALGNILNNDPTGNTISSVATGTSFNGDWFAESGVIGLDYPDNKYLSRFDFRINLFKGAWVELFIQYDSDGKWLSKGRLYKPGLQSFILPVIPRRCDHCRFKLVGHGDFRLYSIAKLLEMGSDV